MRTLLAIAMVLAPTATRAAEFDPNQLWTSTFYGDRGTQFVDVTGDGRADAVAVSVNAITVRRSSGAGFGGDETWSWDPAYPYYGLQLADVNGDSRTDVVRFEGVAAYVRLSTGSGFAAPTLWTNSPFTMGSVMTTLADVTGDGRADLIAVDATGIRVRESASFGPSLFIASMYWSNPFYGNRSTRFADVNGDGKADAIAVDTTGIRVALSDGYSFAAPVTWLATPFYSATGQGEFFADVTGDAKADAIVVDANRVWIRPAIAGGFGQLENATQGPYYGTRGTFFADVTGDALGARADAIVVNQDGITVRRAVGAPGAVEPPASGDRVMVSTIDLAGPQATASRLFDAQFHELSSSTTPDRFGGARQPATLVAYVSTNVPPASMPQRLRMLGSVRMLCEAKPGGTGQHGVYTETYTPIFTEVVPNVAKASLAVAHTVNPDDYRCPPDSFQRRLEVEAHAQVFDASGAMVAISPVTRFTMIRTLKVMAWNIQGGYAMGTPEATMGDITRVISDEKPDVVALQEVHVRFQAWSNFIDEMEILRPSLGASGLNTWVYQPRCDRGRGSTDGLAIFTRLPAQSVSWQLFGIVPSKCAAGFNTYDQQFGLQALTVAFGGTSLVLGNTHFPSSAPNGSKTAMVDWGILNVDAMNQSPFTYLMSGDYNSGPGNPTFAGIDSDPTRVMLVDRAPGITSVNVPDPTHDWVDHMFFKLGTVQVLPVATYFRPIVAPESPMSDHLPLVTLYDVTRP